jgi:predicted dehydrogenase
VGWPRPPAPAPACRADDRRGDDTERVSSRIRLAVVGCGDVAYRHYLPALAALADRVEIVGFVDPRPGAAQRAADHVAAWSPSAEAFTDVPSLLASSGLDGAIDLTPAPAHAATNEALLEGDLHVYSEKPLAGSIADADRLIDTAAKRGRLLLCAPGVMVTERFRWTRDVVRSGRFGPLTLAVTHHADPGPAAWREYTGDPAAFYAPGVGPVFDHGVYRLHWLTGLLGPVRRVQAMGAISSPTRVVRGTVRTGETIDVTTPDHVLINLEFAGGGLGQLLASFGTPSTLAPWLELHFPMATISFAGQSYDKDAVVSLYVDDDGPLGLEAWTHGVNVPMDEVPVVEAGVRHFVACLAGDEQPVLTAEQARHVLEVILRSYESIDDGRSHDVVTRF